MNFAVFYLVVSVMTVAVVAYVCMRMNLVQDREIIRFIFQEALHTRRDVVVGLTALGLYLLMYLVLGNYLVWFYGRLLLMITPQAALIAIASALLVGVLFMLFSYNLRSLGLTQGKRGAWGIAGTLVALAVSFCP